jgi:hypothetical protein
MIGVLENGEASTALQAVELMAWNDHSAQQWRAFANATPNVLAVPCDIFRATKHAGEAGRLPNRVRRRLSLDGHGASGMMRSSIA